MEKPALHCPRRGVALRVLQGLKPVSLSELDYMPKYEDYICTSQVVQTTNL